MVVFSYFDLWRDKLKQVPNEIYVASSSWISKITTSLLGIISIRIFFEQIGNDGYAAFALITGLLGWFALLDLGIGNSVQNFISESRALKKSPNKEISSSLFLVCIFSLVVVLFILVFGAQLGDHYFKSIGISPEEKKMLFLSSVILFFFQTLGTVAFKMWYAFGKGYFPNLIQAFGYVLGFLFLVLCHNFGIYRDEIALNILGFLAPNAIFGLSAFVYFNAKYLKRKYFDKGSIIKVFKRSKYFWLFSVLSALVLQVDILFASQYLDANDISEYNLLKKIFEIAFFLYSSLLAALWPVTSEMLNQKRNFEAIMKLLKYLVIGIGLVLIVGLGLTLGGSLVFKYLAGSNVIEPRLVLIWVFVSYYVLRIWTDTFVMVLMSINKLKLLMLITPIQVFIGCVCQYFLVMRYGSVGLMIGLCVSFILTVAWVIPLKVKDLLNS